MRPRTPRDFDSAFRSGSSPTVAPLSVFLSWETDNGADPKRPRYLLVAALGEFLFVQPPGFFAVRARG